MTGPVMFRFGRRASRRLYWVGAVIALACASGTETSSENQADEQERFDIPSRRTRLELDELPPMPGYPDGQKGRLVSVSDGDFALDGVWRAEAGVCPSLGTLELYTEDLRNGTAIVLHFPDSQLVGRYPILPADTGLTEDRVARIGVQVFGQDEAFGFRAIDGTMEVTEADGRLSGRFQSTLRETQIELLTRYVGVFQEIPVGANPSDYCDLLRDSLLVKEDSTVGEDSTTPAGDSGAEQASP